MSQPQEPWNCGPLPAEKQQEILVEGDKETAVVTGSCPSCPRAPVMALSSKNLPILLEVELLPWTDTTPVPSSPGCPAALMASHILV